MLAYLGYFFISSGLFMLGFFCHAFLFGGPREADIIDHYLLRDSNGDIVRCDREEWLALMEGRAM